MSVEFLSDGQPAVPDDRPVRPRRRRPGWLWALLAVALATALVWVLTRPSDQTPVAEQTPGPIVPTRVDPACNGVPSCGIDDAVPPSIKALANRYFPRTTRVSVRTVASISSLTQERLLVQRDIRVTTDSVVILVDARRGAEPDQPISNDPPGDRDIVLHTAAGGFILRLEYLAPVSTPAPDQARLLAFLGQPGLLRTG